MRTWHGQDRAANVVSLAFIAFFGVAGAVVLVVVNLKFGPLSHEHDVTRAILAFVYGPLVVVVGLLLGRRARRQGQSNN